MLKRTALVNLVFVCMIAGSVLGAPEVYSSNDEKETAKATFAGGCFWCMEEAFEPVEGVVSVVSGYTGGQVENPTYEQVSAGGTGHTESIEVTFDPQKVSYEHLLEVFWRNVDPTTPNAQFCDHGNQYRTAIFYHDKVQQQLIEVSKNKIEISKNFPESIVTEVAPASAFYPAEEYHQDFYSKNPVRYKYYKWNCGRAKRLEQLWGKS
ncbi:MAG: peptide-methionine (S)-S-oxide reductase MsrA [Nitrospirota bacterium]|nr:peptide-methionine (S)-S-oxide reductase MsrA [Nitrospirota bacterium]MDH5587090.1 peptide-methionine (S)-S-oxide reductase MsrA [Nitrospirota bacterium]MDH5775130.1 peptide-methionine (S)-S-oxide reductase MsrA [Nitrospirota bacterium]